MKGRSISRLPDVRSRYPKSRAALYDDIARGLFPRPIKFGARCAGWPDDEIDAVISARIAGEDDDAIRWLVKRLHEARKSVASSVEETP